MVLEQDHCVWCSPLWRWSWYLSRPARHTATMTIDRVSLTTPRISEVQATATRPHRQRWSIPRSFSSPTKDIITPSLLLRLPMPVTVLRPLSLFMRRKAPQIPGKSPLGLGIIIMPLYAAALQLQGGHSVVHSGGDALVFYMYLSIILDDSSRLATSYIWIGISLLATSAVSPLFSQLFVSRQTKFGP
ncbi:hypothetical protein BC827DRAFT_825021 [Russula dissimulans]|nr:hypothetical protein BC827DRAFT_825021 [Russula dissimulans]